MLILFKLVLVSWANCTGIHILVKSMLFWASCAETLHNSALCDVSVTVLDFHMLISIL